MRRAAVGAALGLLVLANPLAAQRPRGPEIGLFGSYTAYDHSFGLRGGPGIGGRVGYLWNDHWSVELDADWQAPNTSSGGNANVATAGANILYNTGRERPVLFFLAGYSRLGFDGVPPSDLRDNALRMALGGRVFLSNRFAVRIDGGGWYTFSTSHPAGGSVAHIGVRVGLTMFPTAQPPADADHDGVPDALDRCRDTPAGAIVDLYGCPTDSDADGVPDGLDACPNTPAGALVDARGCPVDSDHDGIPDGIDQCPATPPNVAVDQRGCPLDADGDGVPDNLDRCPGTPGGTPVDSVGCPIVKDSDGDGVSDGLDRCPGTPAGTPVDSVGCPVLFTAERAPLVLRGVNFETGKSRLTEGSYAVLDQVAASLLAHQEIRIEIAGYTDNTGATTVNTRLSAARAQAVRTYLARRGVAPARMVAQGYGPANPISPNDTPDGRARNRRVELHLLP